MPSKKKKYNARFPPARIKKIMQTDDEVGKVAAAVPVIISRALELFVEALINKANEFTQSRNAKTLSTLHLKQCILSETKFDFLKDLVTSIPDVQVEDDTSNSSLTSTPAVTTPQGGDLVKGIQIKTKQKRKRRNGRKKDLNNDAGPSISGADDSDNSNEDESDVEDDDDEETRITPDHSASGFSPSSFQVNTVGSSSNMTSVTPATNSDDEDYDS